MATTTRSARLALAEAGPTVGPGLPRVARRIVELKSRPTKGRTARLTVWAAPNPSRRLVTCSNGVVRVCSLAAQSVSYLGEEDDLLGLSLECGVGISPEPTFQGVVRLDHEEEEGQRHQEERDHRIEKAPVTYLGVADGYGERGEVRLTGDGGDQRCQEVLDQGGDNGGEGDTENESDGDVEQAAFEGKLPEFLDQPGLQCRGQRAYADPIGVTQ